MDSARKRVLVTDSVAAPAMQLLRQNADVAVRVGISHDELCSIIGDYHALMVRSQTRVTRDVIEAGSRLEIIGRAGVGVDNIDVEAATRKGIFVVNSPEGNIVSAAEHTWGMLLAAARHIPLADRKLRSGVWDRSLQGVEIRNKVLGIIGFGRVGSTVAEIARGFRMTVLAYDPMVSQAIADKIGARLVDMNTLLSGSDFITVHVPLTSATRGLIGREQIEKMKPTAVIINCARGGIIDEQALYEAVESGRLAGAAVDVFTQEPATGSILIKSNKIVVTPHLAASTIEAETSAGTDVAEQIVAVLQGLPPKSPVNAPRLSGEIRAAISRYVEAARMLGLIGSQMAEGQVKSVAIRYQGDTARQQTAFLKAAVVSGLLERLTDERVNIVNVDMVAAGRGLSISEQTDGASETYSNLITVTVETTAGSTTVAASLLRGRVYLVRVNDFWLEIEPAANYMLFTEHRDRPGMIGAVGTILGNAGVNISQMQVSRELERGGKAMMALCLDDDLTPDLHRQLLAIPDMYNIHVVRLAE